jgi:hypothetical protein
MPVTFQVALIGTDGLVVASDRRVAYATRSPEGISVQLLEGLKFAKADDDSVICAFAGGPLAPKIGREIASQANQYLRLSELEWARGVQTIAKSVERPVSPRSLDEITVIRRDCLNKVWIVGKSSDSDATALPIETHICTGDISTARFLVEHLYCPMPVAELRKLAHLTVCYAAKSNPSSVGGGVDILCVTKEKVEWSSYQVKETQTASFTARLREAFGKMPAI